VNEAIAGFLVGPIIFDAADKLIKTGQAQTADKLDNPILCLLIFQQPNASELGVITAAA
jgi:hypothetical protein